jgi:hypothetical protein
MIRRQRGGALEEGRGGGQAAAGLGATGGSAELRGDILVGACRRLGEVPGAPIGIGLGVGRLGQRPMPPPPLLRRCRPVDRRAHQRMAKPHPAVDLDQSGQLRRLECGTGDRESRGRTPQERRIAGGLRRDQ